MAKQKFYAVKSGTKTGIFLTWEECEQNVKGVKNAKYKSFSTKKEAEDYLNDKPKEISFSPSTLTAYVDGSYDSSNKVFGWGCVLIDHASNLKKYSGGGNDEISILSHNVAGEVNASMYAINYAIKNGFKNINIFYDYEGIERWATGNWKANKELTQNYAKFCLDAKKKINISFSKVKAHTGDTFNEMADGLAKDGIKKFIEKNNIK